MTHQQVMTRLKSLASPNQKDLEGMARFGINVENALCISMPKITQLASEIKKSTTKDERHLLALSLWKEKAREAKILAPIIDVKEMLTSEQMEDWVKDFDSWDICDNAVLKLFSYSPLGWEKAIPWSERHEEFVKRAGYVLMACLATHDKVAEDEKFYPFLEAIKKGATDPRNFVKKAVNWALRGIGKSRTKNLYKLSIKTAEEILNISSRPAYINSCKLRSNNKEEEVKAARWVANGALNELKKEYIAKRFE